MATASQRLRGSGQFGAFLFERPPVGLDGGRCIKNQALVDKFVSPASARGQPPGKPGAPRAIARAPCAPPSHTSLDTTPEPTVRPPSRIANRRPSCIATGWISSAPIVTLSPGMTISTPSGSTIVPVMSAVRK